MNALDVLFADTLGVPRQEMPQFSGIPMQGSIADKLAKKANGRVDARDAFLDYLDARGIGSAVSFAAPASLKPTQAAVNSTKVYELASSSRDLFSENLLVSRDGYVIDGHHRWAGAAVKGGSQMSICKIDLPVRELLTVSQKWARDFGLCSEGL